MKHLSLTGNMGSGKSTVAKLFEYLGIPVYESDKQAKLLMYHNPQLKKNIRKLLGKEAYSSNGQLNKKYISGKIFKDAKLLKEMNALVHPEVKQDYLHWRDQQKAKYTIQESALSFEIGAQKYVSATIVVAAPYELLVSRSMMRDKIKREQAIARLDKQMPQKKYVKKADYVIYNGLGDLLMPQIQKIHLDIMDSLTN